MNVVPTYACCHNEDKVKYTFHDRLHQIVMHSKKKTLKSLATWKSLDSERTPNRNRSYLLVVDYAINPMQNEGMLNRDAIINTQRT